MHRRVALFAVLATVLVACGDNFQDADLPEFQLGGTGLTGLGQGTGFVELIMPPDEVRTRSQPNIELHNTGDAELTIKRLEWLDRPDRLVALGERGDPCEPDNGNDDCPDGSICLTSSKTCVDASLPEAPFTVEAQRREDLEFAITRGGTEMTCPEVTDEVPLDVQPRYCGALVIETNADNDFGDLVQDGKGTIYFLDPGASGVMEVEPSFLEFTNVQPGTMHSQTFSIQNTGMNPLEIRTISVEDNPTLFNISHSEGEVLPFEIASGTSAQFEVVLTIPEDATDYEVFTRLSIESSAGVANVAVEITSAAGSAPVIELDKEVLRFDGGSSQTLTVSNTGQATLAINGVNFLPQPVDVFYSFTLDGSEQQSVNIPKGESVELVVNFDRPDMNMESSVGVLEIAHNDRNNGFKSEVTLLGDEGDVPIARLHPANFSFLAADGNSSSRDFVIRNVGTAALDVTGITWNFSVGSNAEFQITPSSGSVAPGGLLRGTVSFTGMNASPDTGLAVFDSNNSTPVEMLLSAQDSAQMAPTPVIEVLNQGALRAMAPIDMSAATSMPDARNAIWTLLARPDGSEVFLDAVGEEASFTPDVAGTYTVALTLNSGTREAQVTQDLTVE